MKNKGIFITGLLVVAVFAVSLIALPAFHLMAANEKSGTYSLSPRETGEAILEELTMKTNTVTIRVGSNGCTDKNSFRVDVKKQAGITAKAPHYLLTIYRIKPDECKALVYEGVLITYDLKKEFGLDGTYTFSVANRVNSKSFN